jgi:hypothetical protein
VIIERLKIKKEEITITKLSFAGFRTVRNIQGLK